MAGTSGVTDYEDAFRKIDNVLMTYGNGKPKHDVVLKARQGKASTDELEEIITAAVAILDSFKKIKDSAEEIIPSSQKSSVKEESNKSNSKQTLKIVDWEPFAARGKIKDRVAETES